MGVFDAALGRGTGRALDLGCGTGACALILARLGYDVTGVDGSEGMLAVARAAAAEDALDIRFIESDILSAPAPDASFDVITIRNVLWTLPDPSKVLARAKTLLAPGGQLLVADGRWRQTPDPRLAHLDAQMPHGAGLDPKEAEAMLCSAGFGQIEIWQHLFVEHPCGMMYDAPDPIRFSVLTAQSGS